MCLEIQSRKLVLTPGSIPSKYRVDSQVYTGPANTNNDRYYFVLRSPPGTRKITRQSYLLKRDFFSSKRLTCGLDSQFLLSVSTTTARN